MRKFTRIITLALALVMMLCLASCGADVQLKILDTEYIEENYAICVAKENNTFLEDVNTALEELIADGTVQKIVDKYISGVEHDLVFQENTDGLEVIKMGTNAEFPPYEYYTNNEIVGIDAEVAAAIADKLGKKLEIVDMAFDSIITSVQTGKVDFGMAGLTVTPEREENVSFTTSYATGVQVIIVREDSEITSVDDLFAGDKVYKVGVQTSTTGDIYATMDLEDEGLAEISRYNKGADAVAALVSGKIDCVIIDNEPAKEFVAVNND